MLLALLFILAITGRRVETKIAAGRVPLSGVDGTWVVGLLAYPGSNVKVAAYVGKCLGCGRGIHAEGRTISVELDGQIRGHRQALLAGDRVCLEWGAGYLVGCPCGKRGTVKRIIGKRGRNHECNAKCLASTGPSCECKCRGANHGRSFAAA